METISLTISVGGGLQGSSKEKEVLIKTANYLQDLAGESQGATLTIRDESAPPSTELDPEKEALATSDHIDAMVATAGAAELDIDGRKWDVRIDSSAKSKTTDGRWKIARNKDKALVEQVKAELLSVAPAVALAVAPVVETPAAVVVPAVAPPVETAPVETAPVVVPVVETPAAAITTYVPLVNHITAMSQTVPPKLQAHDVMDALNSSGAFMAGATTLTELAKPEHAHLIPLVAAELEKLWITRA